MIWRAEELPVTSSRRSTRPEPGVTEAQLRVAQPAPGHDSTTRHGRAEASSLAVALGGHILGDKLATPPEPLSGQAAAAYAAPC
jgi:hypothetical protein